MEDDHKRIRRKRAIRVMITEILMFFSVIILVVFLTLIVLGYNFNIKKIGTEELIERAGLVQVSSVPSGATVSVDGEEGDLFSRTNFSKTLGVGEHSITLTREGYDSWTRKVKIKEGLLFRLTYPRLFLKEREKEEILELDEGEEVEFLKNGRYLIITERADEESSSRAKRYLDLNENKPSFKEVKASDLEDESEIKQERRLAKIKEKFSDEAELTLGEYLGEEYVVSVERGVLIGEEMILREGAGSELEGAKNFIKFYKDETLESGKKKTFFEKEVEFKVKGVEIRGKGELVVVSGEDEEGGMELIYDFETGEMLERRVEEGEKWLDEFLKYKISENKIEVFDFDGENRKEIVKTEGVEEEEEEIKIIGRLGAKISANNRYLYYFIADSGVVKLVREKIN